MRTAGNGRASRGDAACPGTRARSRGRRRSPPRRHRGSTLPRRASADGRRRTDTGSVGHGRARPAREEEPVPGERRPRDQEEPERRRQGQRARLRHQDHARDHRERQVAPPRHVERVEHLDPQEQRGEREPRLVDRSGRAARSAGTRRTRRAARRTAPPSSPCSTGARCRYENTYPSGRERERGDRRPTRSRHPARRRRGSATSTAAATTTRIAIESSGGPVRDASLASVVTAPPPSRASASPSGTPLAPRYDVGPGSMERRHERRRPHRIGSAADALRILRAHLHRDRDDRRARRRERRDRAG